LAGAVTTVRIATRGSALARWQAEEVGRRLAGGLVAGELVSAELVVVDTAGDRRQDVPVWEMGGQGVFVKEVQAAVLDGRADLAVHSAKDLPSEVAPGLTLAAFPVRADPRDALVGGRLDSLAPGASIATGSVRRRAQLAWIRPDLTFVGLRGNIATRLSRVPPGGAVVVAAAALERLGWSDRAAEVLDPSLLVPQVGQGAIAVECRADDVDVLALLAAIDDPSVRAAVEVERAFLARLGGGCDLPVGAYAQVAPAGSIRVDGVLASLDGRIMLRATRYSDAGGAGGAGGAGDRVALGTALAEGLLGAGGAELSDGVLG
jgi:hydroxymethylbilane synthase